MNVTVSLYTNLLCTNTEEGELKERISQTVGYVWTQADALMSADHVKRPHIMIVFSADHNEARASRHVWPASLSVNSIQQYRFPSVFILRSESRQFSDIGNN